MEWNERTKWTKRSNEKLLLSNHVDIGATYNEINRSRTHFYTRHIQTHTHNVIVQCFFSIHFYYYFARCTLIKRLEQTKPHTHTHFMWKESSFSLFLFGRYRWRCDMYRNGGILGRILWSIWGILDSVYSKMVMKMAVDGENCILKVFNISPEAGVEWTNLTLKQNLLKNHLEF